MRYIAASLFLLTTSCLHISTKPSINDTKLTRTDEYQKEIDMLLAEDADIKKWERIYLKEIQIAQESEDNDAYKFFVIEFLSLPRLRLPEWLKNEPNYDPGLTSEEIDRAKLRVIIK